jgi:organic radical activating enzyme
MNILVTTVCNRRCPYCFAASRVSNTQEDDKGAEATSFISSENFGRALAFTSSQERVVGILGGEPSLHPEFARLIEQTWAAGFCAKVFTNGVWSEQTLAAVEQLTGRTPSNLKLVVNTNHPDITSEPERVAQQRLFTRLPKHCSLSFNIHSLEQTLEFLVDIIVNHGLMPNIRLGIAAPLAEQTSEFIPLSEYPKAAPLIMALAERCDTYDIRIGFDCGFTLCMFTPEQLGLLQTWGADFKASCGPAIDVGVDLTAWACFPLATLSKRVSIEDYRDSFELGRYFEEYFEPLYRTGALPECIGCKHLKRKRCSGGCAAHTYRRYA